MRLYGVDAPDGRVQRGSRGGVPASSVTNTRPSEALTRRTRSWQLVQSGPDRRPRLLACPPAGSPLQVSLKIREMPPHPCPGHRLVYPSGPGISVGPCGRVPASGLAPETSPESLAFAVRWHSGWPHAEDPGEGSRTPEAAETEGVPERPCDKRHQWDKWEKARG